MLTATVVQFAPSEVDSGSFASLAPHVLAHFTNSADGDVRERRSNSKPRTTRCLNLPPGRLDDQPKCSLARCQTSRPFDPR